MFLGESAGCFAKLVQSLNMLAFASAFGNFVVLASFKYCATHVERMALALSV